MGVHTAIDLQQADRRDPRREESAATTVVGPRSGRLPVRVLDISCGGFRCEGAIALEPGTDILLGIGGDTVRATIRWKRGMEVGCQFATPLTQAEAEQAFSQTLIVRPNANAFRQRMMEQAEGNRDGEAPPVAQAAARPAALLQSLRRAFRR